LIQLSSKFHDNWLIRQKKLISGKDISWLDEMLNNKKKENYFSLWKTFRKRYFTNKDLSLLKKYDIPIIGQR